MSRRSSTGSERGAAPAGGAGPRILHFDAFSGIAGNMVLGALLDLGLERRALASDLAGLDVRFTLDVRRVRRGPLDASYVAVRVPQARRRGASGASRNDRAGAARSAAHRRDHPHGDPPHHDASSSHDHDHGRSHAEIQRIIARGKLAPAVRDRALAIFEALAAAEARVHGIPIDAVHFHEVGAVDAIVDVTGVAIGLQRLGIDCVTCTPLPLGHGFVDSDHGRLPLPAPATLELLRGAPVVPAGIAWETVTPTGAAIVRTVVDEFCTLPAMQVEAIGLGAGNDRAGGLPNVLRAVLGRGAGFRADRVAVLETHVDDLNPEHFEYLMERLFEAGALDVALMHLQMKKNRPGFAIRVVARPAEREELARVLFAESTTLGVRVAEMERVILTREERKIVTPFGAIRVKIARDPAGRGTPSAEYEDCKVAAKRAGVPLREVVRAAEEAARALEIAPPAARPKIRRRPVKGRTR